MKILIAEEDAQTRRQLATTLGERGHQIISVDDGAAAWRELESENAPQLAILDWATPKINGIEICRRVRRQLHAKSIYLMLLLAPGGGAPEVAAALSAGADDYLTKPINAEELRARTRIGERIIELRQSLAIRVTELETALTVIETAESDLQNSRERQMLLESVIEQIDLSQIIQTAEQTNVSILITNAELDAPGPEIVFVNQAFTRMTGYVSSEIAGKTPRILQGAETDFAVLKRLRRALQNGEKFFGETVNYRKDRTPYNLEWHISPLKTPAGKVTHFVAVQHDITARKQVEGMLRESREYRNLFNLANDSIVVFDPETEVVLNVNDKACENYRISRESFVGMSLRYLSLDRERDEQMLKTLLADGASEEFETIHLRGDGSTMNVLINSSIVTFKGQLAVLSINRDITERHRSELRILRAKREWSDTVDAISDLIILEDGEGKIQRCNEAARLFFNLSYLELIGQPLTKLLNVQESRLAGKSRREPLRAETWEGVIGASDQWYEITNHKTPLDGNQGWVHIVKNISARKAAEATLRRLNTAIEQAADGIVIMDQSGTIQFVNPAFEQISRFSAAELVGKQFFNLRTDAAKDENSERRLQRILLGEVWHGSYRARRRNGELYEEEATVSPVRDADGDLLNFVAVCRDVTEKRRLESIAEAVNMMDNVGFVFSGIRHELGNPINSIKVALTVLKKNLETWNASQVQTYIERCLTETTRVEYLLRALKTFSMHENPKMQAVDLNAFMQNFVTLIENDFNGRGIQIVFANGKESNTAAALCDPRALHQVMLNLLANSADALETKAIAQITIKVKRDRHRIRISVADNGAGMNETQLSNLFKPFYTSKPNGTGLGLVIVKKMIAKMNGTILISSELGVGTEARLTLEAAKR